MTHQDYEKLAHGYEDSFMNGFLEEGIHKEQPKTFTSKADSHKVDKLYEYTYGFKKTSRSWNIHFDDIIGNYDIIKNEEEPSVCNKASGS